MSFLFALAAATTAQTKCDDMQTQSQMTYCAGLEYRRADAAMNRQWIKTVAAMKTLDREFTSNFDKRAGYFAALLEAQRTWLKYRDAHCISEGYQMRGGSGEPMLVNLCLASLTEDRTKQLHQLEETK